MGQTRTRVPGGPSPSPGGDARPEQAQRSPGPPPPQSPAADPVGKCQTAHSSDEPAPVPSCGLSGVAWGVLGCPARGRAAPLSASRAPPAGASRAAVLVLGRSGSASRVCVCVCVSRRPWLHCHSRSSLSWWLLSCSASSYTKPRHGHTRVYKKRVTRSVQHYLQFRRPLGGPQCPPRMGAAAVSCGAQPNGRSAVLCRACVPVCTCSRATACAHAQDSWRPAASLCRAPARPPGPGQPRRSLSLLSTVPAKASLRAPLPQDPALIM